MKTSIKYMASVAMAMLAAGSARGEEAAADSDVLVLTKDTFKGVIDAESTILVEFYAPWCGHCKSLHPEYEKAATELKGTVKIAKVDCTEHNDICTQEGVQGFPTLKVYKNGVAKEFGGKREASSIVSYMERQVKPAVSEVTADGMDAFIASDKVVCIGFFSDASSDAYKTLSEAADGLRDSVTFGATVDAALAKAHGVTAPTVMLFRKFDDPKVAYDGSATDADALAAFIKAQSVPLMDDIGPENYGKYVETKLPLAFLFTKFDDSKAKIGAIVEPVAKAFKGKVNFVYIDASQFGAHADNLNLKEGTWPAFAVTKIEAQTKFPYPQDKEITTDALHAFVQGVVDGTQSPSLKSEPIPASNDGPVKTVVMHEFKDIVMDTSRDVLIEFYAPWCTHCKTLAPKWEVLGEAYGAHKDTITIAKMDATANDFPADVNVDIKGFPTIMLFKAGSNEVQEFEGSREVASFIKFLGEHATNKVEVAVPADAAADAGEGDDEGDEGEEDDGYEAEEEHEEL